MDREHILSEIRRTARENGGVPLGRARFLAATGIREADWLGKHWARWSDAIRQAGLEPNKLRDAYPRELLIERYAQLVREIGHLPTVAELRLKASSVTGFPNPKTFARLGKGRPAIASTLIEFGERRKEYEDVVSICRNIPAATPESVEERASAHPNSPRWGSVYLVKSGKFYNIGGSNSVGRRQYELSIQLPERVGLIHSIKTDDPAGIETYWHARFGSRRKNGEWFDLSRADIAAFKRRRFM